MCNCKHNGTAGEDEFSMNEYETMNEWELLPELEYEFQNEVTNSTEQKFVTSSIAQGKKDENDLTNDVFFKRHPELPRKPLSRSHPNFTKLSKEWLEIRDKLVRPILRSSPGRTSTPSPISSSPVSSIPGNPNIPPVEGPVKPIVGRKCASGKKCWDGPKSADIIDDDAPWNRPGNRSAANYVAVLDYFNPGEDYTKGTGNTIKKPSENPRYRQRINENGVQSTYCNIYVHDATRAMWANIPHWVKSGRTGAWNELSANATVDWMQTNGTSIGWFPIKSLVSFILQYRNNRSASPQINLSAGILQAAQQIASGQHDDPSLLNQPSYLAQRFANLGLPSVAIMKKTGGIGHVAMIRPEDTKKGEVQGGVFRPRSAQAGAANFSNNFLVFGPASIKSGIVQFHVHE